MPSKFRFSLVLLSSLLAMATAQAQLPQPVSTVSGLVQGEMTAKGITAFKGLPYAAPPVAENRWREPQAVAPWSGIRLADRYGPRCVQRGFAVGAQQVSASEDCLYLNVWTPAKTKADKLPVLVWIHGGGYFAGSGSEPTTEGTNLAAHGAVVVGINYRLGTFGFLALPELTAESPHHSSGNYALLDMLAALQWVQTNIEAFGGDAGNVTVVGESVGAQSAGVLIASPLSKGLFKRAILQSSAWMGFGVAAQATLSAREQAGAELMKKAGADSLAALRRMGTQEVFDKIPAQANPTIDGYLLPEDATLIFASNEQQAVDVLVGSNSNEAAFFGGGQQTLKDFQNWSMGRFTTLTPDFTTLFPVSQDADAQKQYYLAFSAEMAWHVRRLAQYQREKGNQGFVYYFSHVPPGGEARGATHVSELAYVFNQAEQNPKWTPADNLLSDQIARYWVNFAASGNPNGANLPQWPAYQADKAASVMGLADQASSLRQGVPERKHLEFFERLYQRHLQQLKR